MTAFPKILGQRRAAAILQGLLDSGRMPAALLFHGPDGTGKALLAQEFAKALLCGGTKAPGGLYCGACPDCSSVDKGNHSDLVRVNAHYQAQLREEEPERQKSLRVETIRHLRRDMELRSLLGRWKIAIVEEAHTLEIEAANALLKILEEPEAGSLWILTTSQRERLPRTVLSRCFHVPFSPLSAATLRGILEARGLPAGRAEALAALCDGSVRRALELEERGYPEALSVSPLEAASAAEALPRELYLARSEVELALFALSQDLRLRVLRQSLLFSRAEGPLRELSALRRALRSNADPRAVLTLAHLAASGVPA